MATYRRRLSMTPRTSVAAPPSRRGFGVGVGGFARSRRARSSASAPTTASGRVAFSIRACVRWTIRGLVLAAGLYVLGWVAARLWVVLQPIALAVLLTSVLWAPVRWMRRWIPGWAAAAIAVVVFLLLLAGLVTLLVQVVTAQAAGLAAEFASGVDALRNRLSTAPFGLGDQPLVALLDRAGSAIRANSGAAASVAFTIVDQLASIVINAVLALVLSFLILKDGGRMLPWLRGWMGDRPARHVGEVAGRSWQALGRFIWSQAAVACVDAVLIGAGIWILGVPFALPLAVLIFLGAFVPIVGAFVTGALATLIALVSGGIWVALAALGIVIVVQQLEGNVLQPLILGTTLRLHPAVILLGVILGGSLAGIVGAFFAVPVIAVLVVTARYLRELAAGEDRAALVPGSS